jgi:hypothetical protein
MAGRGSGESLWVDCLASALNLDKYMVVITGHSRSKNGVASLAYAPVIHALLLPVVEVKDVDGWDERAFTPVFDGLCPAMTAT